MDKNDVNTRNNIFDMENNCLKYSNEFKKELTVLNYLFTRLNHLIDIIQNINTLNYDKEYFDKVNFKIEYLNLLINDICYSIENNNDLIKLQIDEINTSFMEVEKIENKN